MHDIFLVCLIFGTKKNGNGRWYKAQFKGHNSNGNPVTAEYFLSTEVGEKMVRDGLIEDVNVRVTFDFDEYLRPAIVSVTKAANASSSKVVEKL